MLTVRLRLFCFLLEKINKNNIAIRVYLSWMKSTLEYLFLIIIYSLNIVAWPSGKSHAATHAGDEIVYLESALADKLENYKLPVNSLVTLDAGECSWGC